MMIDDTLHTRVPSQIGEVTARISYCQPGDFVHFPLRQGITVLC